MSDEPGATLISSLEVGFLGKIIYVEAILMICNLGITTLVEHKSASSQRTCSEWANVQIDYRSTNCSNQFPDI